MTIAHPLSPYQGDGQSTEAYSREFHLTVGLAPHGANDELWAKNGAKEVFPKDPVSQNRKCSAVVRYRSLLP